MWGRARPPKEKKEPSEAREGSQEKEESQVKEGEEAGASSLSLLEARSEVFDAAARFLGRWGVALDAVDAALRF